MVFYYNGNYIFKIMINLTTLKENDVLYITGFRFPKQFKPSINLIPVLCRIVAFNYPSAIEVYGIVNNKRYSIGLYSKSVGHQILTIGEYAIFDNENDAIAYYNDSIERELVELENQYHTKKQKLTNMKIQFKIT